MSVQRPSRRAMIGVLAALPATLKSAGPSLRVAAFEADATPPLGEPLIWVTPAKEVLDPLLAKGVVIDDGRRRVVLCALDWCGIGGSTHTLFRRRIAEAAKTPLSNVAVQTLHQHTAPYIDGDGYALMEQLPNPPLRMSAKALDTVTERIAAAVRQATARMQNFDRVGTGEAAVEEVASARRIRDANGTLVTRFSTAGKTPAIAALPEGAIDRKLRTLTFAKGDRPIARLHYYATHPQTFCCDGRVTADFVGAARKQMEASEGVPQIYFTGCAGDVTVGKYNDSSSEAYKRLKDHLLAALKQSAAATRYSAAGPLSWRTAPLSLPERPDQPSPLRDMKGRTEIEIYRAAITLAFAQRRSPIELSALGIGRARVLHLPGEPMLEFQRYARNLANGREVLVAGYGDISPGYLCTDEAHRDGGYEPSAANAGPGTEGRVKRAIQELLAG